MKSVSVLIVEKNGSIKETPIKKCVEEEFYKKAGLKSNDGFNCLTTWNVDNLNGKKYCISLYGKKNGRAGQENKYEFPPPVDSDLFFGNCLLVNTLEEKYISLTTEDWKLVYNHLYGGFEDLNDDSEEEEDEDDDLPKTTTGYVKDGFIVDDDEDIDEEYEDDDEDEDEDEDEDDSEQDEKIYKSKRKIVTRSSSKKNNKSIENVFCNMQPDLTSELVEEEYI